METYKDASKNGLGEPELSWPINMLWIGSALGIIEKISIRSFQQQGHMVRLHTYEEVAGVPDGVEIVDASTTAPWDTMAPLVALNHQRASDFFRYRLMRAGAGIWADTDFVCLAPLKVFNGILMGFETPTSINSALLYLDGTSPILKEALRGMRPGKIPSWIPPRARRTAQLKRLLRMPIGPETYRGWTTFGPMAVTELARTHGLSHLAEPVDVYYPLPYERWRDVWEPGSSFETYRTERTKAIHLWHSAHGDAKAPPASSALGRIAAELGV
jgi:hypothetical protein